MPLFDPIGFALPLLFAIFYLPVGVPHLNGRVITYFAFCGLLTYLLPISHSNGVGLIPFYFLYIPYYFFREIYRKTPVPAPIPSLATLVSISFASIAIPDFFLTWERGGAEWTVGGSKWEDGLLRFWLYPLPIAAMVVIGIEWLRAHEQDKKFDSIYWAKYHLSPICARRSRSDR